MVTAGSQHGAGSQLGKAVADARRGGCVKVSFWAGCLTQ